jgi:hypothetical protein|tara:strand:+ start:372 stop:608 length:237 start_codon:yes stop_codon:yes gene_type:complete
MVERRDRVRLVSTTDPYTNLVPGNLGTVDRVDDLGTIHVHWDQGSRLGLVSGEDEWATRMPDGSAIPAGMSHKPSIKA